MSKLVNQFRSARNANCGLVAVETSDYAQTIRAITSTFNGNADYEVPKLRWDIVHGQKGINEAGVKLDEILFPKDPMTGQKPKVCDPVAFLGKLSELAARTSQDGRTSGFYPVIAPHSIIFVLNAHNYVSNPSVAQAIWNIRDVFKEQHCTLVLLSPVTLKLSKELSSDFYFCDDPVPNEEEIEKIINDLLGSDGIVDGVVPQGEDMKNAINACLGLSDFCVEQNVALAFDLETRSLDIDALWKNKISLIKQQQGLEVSRGGERFEDIAGLANVKGFLKKAVGNNRDIKGVVYFEEIEKVFAGAGGNGAPGDSSGTTQDQLGYLLQFMQDNNVLGILLIGPPGTGKSALAKAAGNEIDVPSIQLDLGACKGSLVGQSEQNVRAALGTINAVTAGKAVFIASCNSINNIPPELRRRFSAVFFVDLPKPDERLDTWKLWKNKYNIPDSDNISEGSDAGWSGAEIRQCCFYADRLNVTLDEASIYIAPVSRTSGELVENLRRNADQKYLSASTSGFYKYWSLDEAVATKSAVSFEESKTPRRRKLQGISE